LANTLQNLHGDKLSMLFHFKPFKDMAGDGLLYFFFLLASSGPLRVPTIFDRSRETSHDLSQIHEIVHVYWSEPFNMRKTICGELYDKDMKIFIFRYEQKYNIEF
jgi:hypothetical protein